MAFSWKNFTFTFAVFAFASFATRYVLISLLSHQAFDSDDFQLLQSYVNLPIEILSIMTLLNSLTLALIINNANVHDNPIFESSKYLLYFELLTRVPLFIMFSRAKLFTLQETSTLFIFDGISHFLPMLFVLMRKRANGSQEKELTMANLSLDPITFAASLIGSCALCSSIRYALQQTLIHVGKTKTFLNLIQWDILQPHSYGGIVPIIIETMPTALATHILYFNYYTGLRPREFTAVMFLSGLSSIVFTFIISAGDLYSSILIAIVLSIEAAFVAFYMFVVGTIWPMKDVKCD